MVLITGPTGMGKTTALAAMVDTNCHANGRQAGHAHHGPMSAGSSPGRQDQC
jgi:hypothetical protein